MQFIKIITNNLKYLKNQQFYNFIFVLHYNVWAIFVTFNLLLCIVKKFILYLANKLLV